MEAAKAELMKCNPEFDRKMLHMPHKDGNVGFLSLKTATVVDIARPALGSPLPGVRSTLLPNHNTGAVKALRLPIEFFVRK